MKKLSALYVTFLLLCSSGFIYSMEYDSHKASMSSLPPEVLEKIALYTTNAESIGQAFTNVKAFLQGLGKHGISFFESNTFIKYFVDTLYNHFIPPIENNSVPWESFNKALKLVASLDNNTYAIEKLKKWLDDGGINVDQQLIAATIGAIHDKDTKKTILLIEHMGVNADHLLITAAYAGNEEMARYLIEHGADVNTANASGTSALLAAIQMGHINLAKYLIDNGANVNSGNKAQIAPLMYAILTNSEQLVQHLLDNGAHINATNSEGDTARDIAESNNLTNMVTLLDAEAARRAAQAEELNQ